MDGITKAAVAEASSACVPAGLRAASAASTKDGVDADFGALAQRRDVRERLVDDIFVVVLLVATVFRRGRKDPAGYPEAGAKQSA